MSPGPLQAQSVGLSIADPVPDDLRARVADLMHRIRPADTEAALAATRIIDRHGLWRELGTLFLRVEADCRDDLCMTVIARVTSTTLTPEVTLSAGTLVVFADYGYPLWGMDAHPIDIKGAGDSGTRLWLREGAWVVEACRGCFPSAEELARRPPPPPSTPAPSPTFEEFRGALKVFR
jgi:hypothetical protein